jgi:hypothetical protein
MDIKSVINLIRIADPIGEYFEEFGGIFVKQYSSKMTFTDINKTVLLFITNRQYWLDFEYFEYSNIYLFTNQYLKTQLEFNSLYDAINYDFNDLFINGYNDYHIPWTFEFDYIKKDGEKSEIRSFIDSSSEKDSIKITKS